MRSRSPRFSVASLQDWKKGDVVIIASRGAVVTWNGLPKFRFAKVRWQDSGEVALIYVNAYNDDATLCTSNAPARTHVALTVNNASAMHRKSLHEASCHCCQPHTPLFLLLKCARMRVYVCLSLYIYICMYTYI